MKKSRKPPLGPVPRFIYEENRIRELQEESWDVEINNPYKD